MTKISAAIITFNEEKNIERCITSLLKVADEIVVVDSFSTDKTKEICNRFNVVFIENKFDGHIQQKNFAIDQTSCEYVLSLDADEELSDELKQSILEAKNNLSSPSYKFNRLNNYCGHWVKHCGWYPDTKVRLIERNSARWGGMNPHDDLIPNSPEKTIHLKGDLLHYTMSTREEHYKQVEYFTTIAAKELFDKGKSTNWVTIIAKTIFKFIRDFIIKLGFLDGSTGFTISRISAFATYEKYRKLLELNKQK